MVAPAYPAPTDDLDRPLVSQIAAGDQSALTELIARHRPFLTSWLGASRFFTAEDRDEILSKTFLCAWRSMARFEGRCSVRTWLTKIALNLKLNRIKHNRDVRRFDQVLSLDAPIDEGSDVTFKDRMTAGGDLRDSIELDAFESKIWQAFQQLDERQRTILNLTLVEHKDYRQIADTLGINIGTVKSRIARARQSLRAKVEQSAA